MNILLVLQKSLNVALGVVIVASITSCSQSEVDGQIDITKRIGSDTNQDKKTQTFEEYKAGLPRTPADTYVVEGDVQITTEKDLLAYYESAVLRSNTKIVNAIDAKSIVNTDTNGKRTVWSPNQAMNLTYCIAYDPFGDNPNGGFNFDEYSEVSGAMNIAAAQWEVQANVNFIHSGNDFDCANSTDVVFRISPVSGQNYDAAAFFPNMPANKRNLYINRASIPYFSNFPPFFVNPLDPQTLGGALLHELGHILGLRHEHIRPGAFNSRCPDEDTNWEELTPYDAFSVMHYDWCQDGSTDRDYFLTGLDIEGIQQLYGLPGEPIEPSPIDPPPPVTPENFAWLIPIYTLLL